MAGEVFVDTWGWIEGHWQGAPRFREVHELFRALQLAGARWVTTNCVMLELCGSEGSRGGLSRRGVIGLYEQIHDNPIVDVVHVDGATEQEAFATYFRAYRDKTFSLVDCVSFVVMQRCGIARVITDDDHFRQVGLGFQLLPGEYA